MKPNVYLGTFEQIVLLALMQLRENAYGMTIRREIEDRTSRSISIGAVYTTLERMEKKGFVSSNVGASTASRGGRAKRYYHINAHGMRALNKSMEMLNQMAKGVRLSGAMA